MYKKFGICCVKCKQPLNNEDKILGTSCGHLYHAHCICSDHGKSEKCMDCEAYKPIIFQMHLTFDDAPLAGKLKEKNIEIINKLNSYERDNIVLKRSFNAARLSVQQLESKVKTLKDGLKAKDAVLNELHDRIETLDALNRHLSNKYCDNSVEVRSSLITNENDSTINNDNKNRTEHKQQQKMSFNNGINKGNWYNKNSSIDTRSMEFVQQTTTTTKCNEKNYNEDNITSNGNSRQHATALSTEEKKEFLDDTPLPPSNSVVIENFESDDLSSDIAIINVIRLGQRMDLKITSHDIKKIFIFERKPSSLTYVVEFVKKKLQKKFLEKSPILKEFRKTKFLTIH